MGEGPLIVTCRDVGGEEGWGPLRKELLELGITGGGTHVDIEVTPSPQPPPRPPPGPFLFGGGGWKG